LYVRKNTHTAICIAKQRYENKREKWMDSNNRKSYLKSGKKRYALSKVIFAFRAIIFVNCQADKKIKMQNLEEALEMKC
jgi:hypothetical protein